MKRIFRIFLIFVIGISLFPTKANAETLREYKEILNKFIAEYESAENEIYYNEQRIASMNDQIATILNDIKLASEEVEKKEKEIVEYNEEIKRKSLQTKELFEYLQLSSGENLYLEYAFEAESITDLIYRMSVVEQITEYNDNLIDELETMIEANNARKQELKVKQQELSGKEENLHIEISKLQSSNSKLNQNAVSAEGQVQIYREIVDRYVDAGCQDDDVVGVDCAVTISAAGWYRPVDFGYVTSEFGERWGTLHEGIDISNWDPYNTKIYPVANGTVSAIYTDYYGALVVAVEHYFAAENRYYTSLYCHLNSYNPNIWIGKTVTINDDLGYMGNTGWSYGAHLHLDIAPCRLYNPYDSNCYSWYPYIDYLEALKDQGWNGPREYIYFPEEWYSR